MAAKEVLKTVKEVTLVTAAGALEGAIILGLVDPLRVGGAVAGGVIGGTTALTTELIARQLPKQTVTVHGQDSITIPTTEAMMTGNEPVTPATLTTDATEVRHSVPAIQVPDTIRELKKQVLARTTGKLQGTRTEASAVENARAAHIVYTARQKGPAQTL